MNIASTQLQETNKSIITTTIQLQEALACAGNKTVLVKFTADWCTPCKKIEPVLQSLASSNASSFNVYNVNIDEAFDLVTHFDVRSMPTFIFFRNNKVVHVLKGASTELLTQAFEIIASLTSA
jgi:thioredoxin